MTTTPTNPLRKGSAGYEAIEAVRRHGPLMPAALAMEIDKPLDEIDQLLRFPLREGLLRIDADGCYCLGAGKPAEAAPAPVPAPAPAPVSDLGAFVRQRMSDAADELQAEPVPQPKPEPARRSPAARPVDIDAIHRRAASAPAPAAKPSDFVAAWCSDGTYVIKKGAVGIELSREEQAQLFQHLSAVARVAA